MGAEGDVKTKLRLRVTGGRAADEKERLAAAESLKTMGLDGFSYGAKENVLVTTDGKGNGGEKQTWNALDGNGQGNMAVRLEDSANDAAQEKGSTGTESVPNRAAPIADRETSKVQTQLPVGLNGFRRVKEQRASLDEEGTAHRAVNEQFMGTDGKAYAAENHPDFGGNCVANGGGEKASIGLNGVRKGTEKGERTKEEKGMAFESGDNPKEGEAVLKGMLKDDEIATTLAAASEKLMAARVTEQQKRKKKQKQPLSKRFGFLHPRQVLCKLRDAYVNSCLVAADKGDMMDLVGSHPGMYYGETVLSRNVSQRKDRDREEMFQALSRQASLSASRQHSTPLSRQTSRQQSHQAFNFTVNTSAGMTGLTRNTSNGLGGFRRQSSGRSATVWSSPSRNSQDHYAAGRSTFLQHYQPTSKSSNMGQVTALASNKSNSVGTLSETDVFRPEINNSINRTFHGRPAQALQ